MKNVKKFSLFLIFLICQTFLFSQEIKAKDGSFSTGSSFYSISKLFKLNCDWEFYWDKTPEQVYELLDDFYKNPQINANSKSPADALIKVPSFWNSTIQKITGNKKAIGKGTYRIVLKDLMYSYSYALSLEESPGTSCAIFINGEKVFTTGNPYSEEPKGESLIRPIYLNFTSSAEGEAEILIFVNNFFYRKGGLWGAVTFGPAQKVFTNYLFLTGFSLFCFGVILFTAIINIIQFLVNKKERQHLYTFIIALASAFRTAVANFNSLEILIPTMSAEVKVKIEFLAIWVIPAAYYMLLIFQYPNTFKKTFKLPTLIFRYTFFAFDIGFGLASLILPAKFSNQLVPCLELCAAVGVVYDVSFIIVNIVRKKKYVFYHLADILCFAGALVFDTIISNSKEVIPFNLSPIFFTLFSIIQMAMLSNYQKDLYNERKNKIQRLQKLNESYLRFVPYEFIKLLKKETITNVHLGDYSAVELSILYTKISTIDTKTSKRPYSEVEYEIYCDFFKLISPSITKNSGFITKFLTNGFIVLFYGETSSDNALSAALDFEKGIKTINEQYNPKGLEIKVYTGAHFGNMILGTIGDDNRLDDTVISDTVNTVARIESVCEKLDRQVIISEELFKNTDLNTINEVNINQLLPISVKGKKNSLRLFECEINEFWKKEITSTDSEEDDESENLEEL